MTDFAEELASLLTREITKEDGNGDTVAHVAERLAASLGYTAAILAGGQPKKIDEVCEGLSHFIHTEAVAKAQAGFITRLVMYQKKQAREDKKR